MLMESYLSYWDISRLAQNMASAIMVFTLLPPNNFFFFVLLDRVEICCRNSCKQSICETVVRFWGDYFTPYP
jgi:hypothetical protein